MSIRLALTSAPISIAERYGSFSGAASTEPAFALVCLAAVAARAGVATAIVDAAAQNLTVEQTARDIVAHRPDVVGISATTAGIVASATLAGRLKEALPNLIVLIGGCHVSALPRETLAEFPAFDIAVLGEGEMTLLEILDRIAAGDRFPRDLAGTAARTGSDVHVNPPRPLITDMDELPLPAWSLLHGFPSAFRPSPGRIMRWPCASIVLTRGCPNQCVFCDRSVFGHRCRGYSAERCVELVKDLRNTYGVKEILIEDDTFIIVKSKVVEFCRRIIDEKVDVTWSCLGRADRVTPDLLALMRNAGCWHISYGIESGDQGVLKAMHKNLDLEQIRQAVRWSRDAGLRTKGFFIVGFPGETRETLGATRAFARTLALDEISVMQMTPFPGSELYDTAQHFGAFDKDWRKMNTLETVFVPQGFVRQDIEDARAALLRDFYFRPSVVARHLMRLLSHPRLFFHLCAGLTALLRILRESPRKRGSP